MTDAERDQKILALEVQVLKLRRALMLLQGNSDRAEIKRVIGMARGKWCGLVYRSDLEEMLFDRFIDDHSAAVLMARKKEDQDAPILLFSGDTGRIAMRKYLRSEITEEQATRDGE